MSPQSKSSTVSRPSSRSEGDGAVRVSDCDMRQRFNGISESDLVSSTSPHPGSSIAWLTARRSLTMLSLTDSLSNQCGEQLPLSKSNTTTARNLISSLWTNTFRWWKRCSTPECGPFPSSKSLSGTTEIRAIRRTLECVLTSMSVALAKLEYTYVDRTE